MPTPNLGIAHVELAQAQKHVTVNAGLDGLDGATQGGSAIAVTGNRTLSAAEFTAGFSIEMTGTPGAPFNLNVPATRRQFRVQNDTDGIATVQVTGGGGASVAVPVSGARTLYCDGTDVTEVSTGESSLPSIETKVNNTGGDQNIGASLTQVAWDNEIRDQGGWHDPVTNNQRIVIGTRVVDVQCELTLLNLASADVEARIVRYNASNVLQEIVTKEINQGASITLAAMNVRGAAAGDYLVVDLLSSDASYDVDGDQSYLLVRTAASGGGGGTQLQEATYSKTGTQAVGGGFAETDVAWGSFSGDTLGMPAATTFTVPAALNGKRARLSMGIDHNLTGTRTLMLRVYKGGTIVGESGVFSGLGNAARQVVSPWFNIATGDVLKGTVRSEDAITIDTSAATFLSIEVKG